MRYSFGNLQQVCLDCMYVKLATALGYYLENENEYFWTEMWMCMQCSGYQYGKWDWCAKYKFQLKFCKNILGNGINLPLQPQV